MNTVRVTPRLQQGFNRDPKSAGPGSFHPPIPWRPDDGIPSPPLHPGEADDKHSTSP